MICYNFVCQHCGDFSLFEDADDCPFCHRTLRLSSDIFLDYKRKKSITEFTEAMEDYLRDILVIKDHSTNPKMKSIVYINLLKQAHFGCFRDMPQGISIMIGLGFSGKKERILYRSANDFNQKLAMLSLIGHGYDSENCKAC